MRRRRSTGSQPGRLVAVWGADWAENSRESGALFEVVADGVVPCMAQHRTAATSRVWMSCPRFSKWYVAQVVCHLRASRASPTPFVRLDPDQRGPCTVRSIGGRGIHRTCCGCGEPRCQCICGGAERVGQALRDASDWHPRLNDQVAELTDIKNTRIVRSRIYVTSASTMHSLCNILRHGQCATDGMSIVSDLGHIQDLNYLTHLVFRCYERDPSPPLPLADQRVSAGARGGDPHLCLMAPKMSDGVEA